MKIVDHFKTFFSKIKNQKQYQLLLDSPKDLYTDLINSPKINTMINNMPQNLSQIEKAYYIYLELGKIVSENPKFIYANEEKRKKHYNDPLDSKNYFGICKSISELYVSILKDPRIGISADLVKENTENPTSHIDVILKIDGKNYIANLIADLSRIKSSRKVYNFCNDLSKSRNSLRLQEVKKSYLENLEHFYGRIDSLTREEIEQLDKKLGYSFFIPQVSKENERGIYTEDVIELLIQDMNNPESFKEYVLHNRNVPEEERLKYKLDYVFENINKLTDFNGKMNYLENIRYYLYLSKKILSPEENSRIIPYAAIIENDSSNIISILKVKPLANSNDKNNNLYYLFSAKDNKYIYKTPEEMKEFVDENSLRIIGTFDKFDPQKTDALEL
ncbi:MAG TPA: hypothetical protein IAB70_04460 [Candidatus Merdicola faecigallinarum]|uniref:Uncharacterized protein n=1 Tax=Candidatus Merdicola faecigallinarum TaxID=2840862 RepID=A0A9D1M1C8_9FIRM|nr:hypothetical protein [Candidatus Merdicola faecigallinarum]